MSNLITFNESVKNFQKFICFSLGQNKYAVAIENVLEIMKLPHLDYPQKLPANIVGILKYNGISANVLDIRFYLDIPVEKYDVSKNLIIIKTDETIFALIADAIEDIIEIGFDKIDRLSYASKNNLIDSDCRLDGESCSIISIPAIEKILKNGCEEKNVDIKKLFPVDSVSNETFYQRALELSRKYDFAITKNIYSEDRFLSFLLDNSIYCMNLCYVKSISDVINLTPIPCDRDYIEGLMTYRGDFITIINTKKFLNLPKNEFKSKSNKVIIIDSLEFKVGFLVDEIDDIIYISEDEIRNKNSKQNSDEKYISVEIIDGNQIKSILNMEKILTDEKMYIDEN